MNVRRTLFENMSEDRTFSTNSERFSAKREKPKLEWQVVYNTSRYCCTWGSIKNFLLFSTRFSSMIGKVFILRKG